MLAAKAIGSKNFMNSRRFESEAVRILQTELEKGYWAAKNGDVYTIEEAWKEIDQI